MPTGVASTVLFEALTTNLHALGEEEADGLLFVVNAWPKQPVIDEERAQQTPRNSNTRNRIGVPKESFFIDPVLACINSQHENHSPNQRKINIFTIT